MRHFVVVFLLSAFVFLAAVAALNYLIDPSGIFRDASGGPEIQLAKILAQKTNALIGYNFDERIFQIFRTRVERIFPPVIITGSSRSMPIGSQTIGVPCFNLAVSTASLEDHVALAVEAGKMPGTKVFLLGIDPWIFNENLGPTGWRSIRDDYEAASRAVGIKGGSKTDDGRSKLFQLINYEYTKASLNLLLHPAKNARAVTATEGDSPGEDRALIRCDGSRVNSLRTSESRVEVINELAREWANPPVLNLANFSFSNRLASDFLKLVDHLKKDFRVVFVLPPYHPISYPLISKEYPDISRVERMLRSEAAKRKIPVIGSYDPRVAGCVESDFSDGLHPTAACWAKIFSNPEWRMIADGIRGDSQPQDSTKTTNHVQ